MMSILLALAAVAGAQDPAVLFGEAREAELMGDFKAALVKYEQVLAANPNIAEVWANTGLVLYELERHKEALRAFEKAAALKPELATPQFFMGVERLRFGQPGNAVAPLQLAVKLEPANAHAHYALASALDSLGQYERALPAYREALKRNPAMEQARYALALAYLNQSRAISRRLLDANSPYGKLLLGEYQIVANVPDAAEASLLDASKALPESPEAAEALRQFRASTGRGDARAVEIQPRRDTYAPVSNSYRQGHYEQALHLLPEQGSERALYWRALIFRALARDVMFEAVRANPDSFRAHLLLGDTAKSMRDEETALTEYERAAALAPDKPDVQLILVQFLAPRDPAAAAAAARRGLSGSPRHAGLTSELGKLLLKRSAHGEAARCFERALASEPSFSEARAGLAEAYAAAGDLAGAIREMERAAPNDPDGAWHYRLGNWYRSAGRAAEAKEAFAETARLKAGEHARREAVFAALSRAGYAGPEVPRPR